MDTGIVVAIVSAIIAGVFQLIGKRMELAHAGRATSLATSLATPIPRQPSDAIASVGRVNFGLALRQVGILQLACNLVALVVGIVMGTLGARIDEIIVAILFIGTLLLIAGFIWVGLSVGRAAGWRHMITVAFGTVFTTLVINALILQAPLTMLALVIAMAQTFISMGIGGVIANKIRN